MLGGLLDSVTKTAQVEMRNGQRKFLVSSRLFVSSSLAPRWSMVAGPSA